MKQMNPTIVDPHKNKHQPFVLRQIASLRPTFWGRRRDIPPFSVLMRVRLHVFPSFCLYYIPMLLHVGSMPLSKSSPRVLVHILPGQMPQTAYPPEILQLQLTERRALLKGFPVGWFELWDSHFKFHFTSQYRQKTKWSNFVPFKLNIRIN